MKLFTQIFDFYDTPFAKLPKFKILKLHINNPFLDLKNNTFSVILYINIKN